MVDKQALPTIHRYQQNPNLFTISNRKNIMQVKVSKTYPSSFPKQSFQTSLECN